jgi:hypothetical protein
MMRTISTALTIALLLGGATVLRASQPDELRDKARAFERAAAALAAIGRTEAAEQLTREAQEILREAERQQSQVRRESPRPEIEREIRQLKERLQDLRVKYKKMAEANASERDQEVLREQISGTERKLTALMERLAAGHQPRPEFEAQVRNIEEAAHRIQHMRVAAENLRAAGIHEVALKLTEQAEKMEREIREAKQRLAREMDRSGSPDPRDAEIRELRKQNERLQAEIKQLREKLGKQ